jgi:uncharacterized membrane protein (UPF0182 family)
MRRPGRSLILIGVGALALYLTARSIAELYTEVLWFNELGYAPVLWTRIGAAWAIRLAAAILAAALAFLNLGAVVRRYGPVQLRREYGNLEIVEQVPARWLVVGAITTSALAGWWLASLAFGGQAALATLAWIRQVPWGITDPLFERDLSFFVFALPTYYRIIDFLLVTTLWCTVLVSLSYLLVGGIRWRDKILRIESHVRLHLIVLGTALVLLLGVRYWLGRYGLLLEGNGIGGGIGYTDIQARLPARQALAILALCCAATLIFGAWYRSWVAPATGVAFLGLGALAIGRVYPALIQKFTVEPNQFVKEAPYIGWNVEFTRRAYGLQRLERRPFPYRRDAAPDWARLEPRLQRLPLWDEDLLAHVYNQIEAIYGYYHFQSVDADRYGHGDGRIQVAIAAREFHLQGLPAPARTWQSLRLNPKYTRGMGVVISPAAGATPAGEPLRWVRNIDPVVRDPAAPAELTLAQPELNFGETLGARGSGQEYIILHPPAESAAAAGPSLSLPGIELSSFPRMLALAWRFHDKNLLFSGELGARSRFVFRRALRERLQALAPFLVWDGDAQPVIAGGRVVWLADGYVATANFPLARALTVRGVGEVRYLRNSVKATVDAVTGEVSLYTVDADDPILETYRRIFPGLIRPLDAMPASLRAHLRYPVLYLRAQAEILREYHLERQEAFFAGQDFWQLPAGEGGDAAEPYRPLYSMMALPGEADTEFLLSVPFIARERQNMTALLVARNDAPHYGELVLYELPRDQQVLGPFQIAALMEQDPAISPQLALWGQAGSVVRLGRIRAVPLDSSFIYVRPVFLSARETSIPELARVIVSDGRAVRMAPSLAGAVRALHPEGGLRPRPARDAADAGVPGGAGAGGADGAARSSAPGRDQPAPAGIETAWRQRALELLAEAGQRLRAGDWAGFGAAWAALRDLLRGDELPAELRDDAAAGPKPPPPAR